MIILIGGEKGGTGKTTITTNLAALRAIHKHDILLVDTDKQGSASFWTEMRDNNKCDIRIPSIQKFGTGLRVELLELQKRYEDIIIDAGGKDSVELRSALTVADKIYIPVQASQFDIWTLSIMNELVIQAQLYNDKLQAYVLLNRAATNPSINEVKEAQEVVSEFENLKLTEIILKERISYRKAAKAGLSIIELEKEDPKAIGELTNLYHEVFDAK